ncbi:MAG: GNAT family N-acetyltransferase [bacterium]
MLYIETPHLRLRDWEASDLAPFRQLNADAQVMRYFPKTLTHEETDSFAAAIRQEFAAYGSGLYAVETKADREFIGFIGFHRATFAADFTPCVEIGWRLKRATWGQGYATEGAKACLDYGFNNLGISEVYSFTAKINKPSERVMQKIGLTFVQEFDHPRVDPGSPLCRHVLYYGGKR